MDQSLFAAPHGLSQRITSFIACACQGIHQLPFFHLIVLIANVHLFQTALRFETTSFARTRWSRSQTARLTMTISAQTYEALTLRPDPSTTTGPGKTKLTGTFNSYEPFGSYCTYELMSSYETSFSRHAE